MLILILARPSSYQEERSMRLVSLHEEKERRRSASDSPFGPAVVPPSTCEPPFSLQLEIYRDERF